MKHWTSIIVIATLTTACTVTGPAEDNWDRYEKEPKLDLKSVFTGKNKKGANTKDTQQSDLEKRIEALEKQQQNGNRGTAPAGASSGNLYDNVSRNQGSAPGSFNYNEWQRAKDMNSQEYQEFLEWKRNKQQQAR